MTVWDASPVWVFNRTGLRAGLSDGTERTADLAMDVVGGADDEHL